MLQTQCMDALARANEVRLKRAEIRRKLIAGELSPIDILDDVPACMATVETADFLTWIPRIGRQRAQKILQHGRGGHPIVGGKVPLGSLSLRTRQTLAVALPDHADRLTIAA